MSDFKDLFNRYIDGHLSKDERAQFFEEMNAEGGEVPGMIEELLWSGSVKGLADPDREEILFQQIMAKDRASRRMIRIRRMSWAAVAASILLVCSTVLFYHSKPAKTESIVLHDMPGKKGAVLMLANGQTISLDTLGNGAVAQQNGQAIVLNNGSLTYEGANTNAVYNTLSTARGREFQLVLPDGSKVWLNAASSIRYPTSFNSSKERRVEVTGEVYFEIAKNENQPFIVSVNGGASQIKVLGTSFNINAYTDEKIIRTTLTAGAVVVSAGTQEVRLEPGQQARSIQQHIQVANADVAQVTAWKEGLFSFKDMPFDEVMRQLSRWYNIDVAYEDGIPDINFEGELGRDVSLSKILFFLEKVGVHYRIEKGKTIVITK